MTENRAPLRRHAATNAPRVVRGIRAHHDQAGGPGLPGGVDRLGDQGGRAPRGAGVAAAQPGRGHDRRGQRGADGGGQHVQPAHQQRLRGDLGVPERGALLGAPVHPPLHRVDIDERQRVGAGQQRGPGGQLDQYPAVHRGELAHVAVVERPQEAAQRRRGADPADRGRERAVAQQVHPVDGVRAGDHPGHQRTDLQPGLAPTLAATRTCWRARSSRPMFWASRTAGTSPACDTRFGSSNLACVVAAVCNNRIPEVPFRSWRCELQQPAFSQVKGHFCCYDCILLFMT